MKLRVPIRRDTLRDDSVAGSMVVADVPAVHDASDPVRALFTLSVLTGVVMLAAGLLGLGSVLRFVSNAVMVGFLSAVGVNIVLGQLANFTGYQAQGSNRVVRAVDTLLHPTQLHLQTLAIGATTIALILLLERTRLGALAWWSRSSLPRLPQPHSDGPASPPSTISPSSPTPCPCPKPRCSGWLHSLWCPDLRRSPRAQVEILPDLALQARGRPVEAPAGLACFLLQTVIAVRMV
jgi:hypothetical protein